MELNTKVDSFYATSLGVAKKSLKKSSSQVYDCVESNQVLNEIDFYWNNHNLFKPLADDLFKDYTSLIIDKLAIIKKTKFYNSLTTLFRNHNESTDYQLNYVLKSFHVQLKNLNNDYKYTLKNSEFFLPFSLIPVVFSLAENELVFFLSNSVSFNHNFSEITIDDEKVHKFIKSFDFSRKIKNHAKVVRFDWITPNIHYEVSLK